MKQPFKREIFVGYETDFGSSEDYPVIYEELDEFESGQRCALYRLVREGTVVGPKSFVPKGTKKRRS